MKQSADAINEALVVDPTLRSYRGPWKGQLVLACAKCQRKLRHSGSAVTKLKKAVKKRLRRHPDAALVTILNVPCLKLCPKGGVTVCTGAQLARKQCSILRSVEDLDALLRPLAPSLLPAPSLLLAPSSDPARPNAAAAAAL